MAKNKTSKTSDYYFGKKEEDAVIAYIKENDPLVRNFIYENELKDPLNKMIESIIRTYKLIKRNVTFSDLHNDTLSFLFTKFHRFDYEKNKKSYSYFGTICKNYLLGLLIKGEKISRQELYFDCMGNSDFDESEHVYEMDINDTIDGAEFIKNISDSIKEVIDNGNLTENEVKVGYALMTLLENWETIYINIDGGNKYTKNLILSTIREMTLLNTKEIRVSMKVFKKVYALLKHQYLDDGLI